ncbi:MAG: hypothetical protein GY716_06140 [bacterium]|nr:hypothetical protein [bacterium]
MQIRGSHRRFARGAAALCLLAAAAPIAADGDARGIFNELQRARRAAGVPDLTRRPELDAVARSRARTIAGMRHDDRLAHDAPVGPELRDRGVAWFERVTLHTDLLLNYPDPVGSYMKRWRGYRQAWTTVMSPDIHSIGLATRVAADGWTILVGVLVSEIPPVDDVSETEKQAVAAVNAVRRERGFGALEVLPELTRAARAHSRDMARRGYFDHEAPDGSRPADRVHRRGIEYRIVAENIQMSRNVRDPVESAVRSWLKSEGHRETLLTPEFTHTGLGVAVAEDATVYFTQLFLVPMESPPPRTRR